MIGEKELRAIRTALPPKGYARIAKKTGYDASTIGKALRDDKYFNKTIVDAALQVIEEHNAEIAELKTRIKRITT